MDNVNNTENATNEASDELSDDQLDAVSGGRAIPSDFRKEIRQVDTSPADNELRRR